ncbi:MAG TPA: hypothetical protein VH854_09910 [Thermoanaerobaculia bacterium]|jgi:hypothetical protein|nr:hypothetical protein [Thermoanaerobaculia bacterium]
MPEPVAVIAPRVRDARDAARRLEAQPLAGAPLVPCTPASYLRLESGPSRIVLCAPAGEPDRAAAFLRRWADRLLWPAPPSDLHRAIDGIRPAIRSPRRLRGPRPAAPRRRHASARLLEGTVDAPRAAAALEAGEPLDWIVESARHVRLDARALSELASRGVRWSALEPVELVGVYGPASLARSRASWARGLPRGVPFWSQGPGG